MQKIDYFKINKFAKKYIKRQYITITQQHNKNMIAEKIINKSKILLNDTKNIMKDEISDLEKDCKKYINNSNKTLEQLIDTFNNLTVEISKLMMVELPTNEDVISANDKIKKLIFINKVEPISMFIKNVYSDDECRISLKDGKDDFFINASTKDILKKNNEKKLFSNEIIVEKFFEFKNHWKNLNDETKHTIKQIMSTLIDITEKYIEIKDDTNDIAKILIKIDTI